MIHEHLVDCVFDLLGTCLRIQVIEHHARGPKQSGRIGDVPACDIRRAAVYGFKHGIFAAQVGAGHQSQPADQPAGQIGEDVAVQVRHDQHVILLGMLHQLHAHVVHDPVVCRDIGIFGSDLLEDGEKQPVAHLQDVGLMHTGHASAVIGPRIGKGVADDALAGAARDDLRRMHGVFIDLFFYADIEIFGVLAEGDDVDILEWGDDGRVAAGRAHIGIQVILFPEHDVDGAESRSHRCGDRRFEQHAGALEGGECLFADQLPALFIQGQADLVDFIGKRRFCSLQDLEHRIGDLRSDAVSLKYGNSLHLYVPPCSHSHAVRRHNGWPDA